MALRFNLSIAMVCMTSDPTHNKNSSSVPENLICDNSTSNSCSDSELEFSWDKPFQGLALSSFFYGYIITQIFGGYTSDRWGGRNILLYGMLVLSIGTIGIP